MSSGNQFLLPFDKKTESVRTKFGNEKIITTWNYTGRDNRRHEVILRHNTKTSKDLKSKRVIVVDSKVRYAEKSKEQFFIIKNGRDQLKLKISPNNNNTFTYQLFINDVSFETLFSNNHSHTNKYLQTEKKQQYDPAMLSDEENADLYLDKTVSNLLKAIEVLKQNKKHQNVAGIMNKIKMLERNIGIINNICNVDELEYTNWGFRQIMIYVCQIENGKFTKYVDNLQKGFSIMNIVSGAELPEISLFLLKKFGIENADDRNGLVKHFQALQIGRNVHVPSAPPYKPSVDNNNHNKNEIHVEGGSKTLQKDMYV